MAKKTETNTILPTEPTQVASPKKEATPKNGGKVDLAKVAQKVFKNTTFVNTLYLSADGEAFYFLCDAQAHAKTLTNTTVTSFERKDFV